MPDLDKVLKALEHHKETIVCNGCPYAGDDDTPQGNCPVYDDAITLLREQEIPGWISVNERLPEDGQFVVVRHEVKGRIYSEVANYIADLWWLDWNSNGLELNVICWYPLPEPPEEEVKQDGK